MATFLNEIKNTVSATNQTKNIVSFTNQSHSHGLAYILTDLLDFVLVGENEDEILIWDKPTYYKNLIKS